MAANCPLCGLPERHARSTDCIAALREKCGAAELQNESIRTRSARLQVQNAGLRRATGLTKPRTPNPPRRRNCGVTTKPGTHVGASRRVPKHGVSDLERRMIQAAMVRPQGSSTHAA